ncbi:hypothetical protein [Nostoc sp. 'Peltigera membranacea cyanobiont' N6]|uniref:hypothetical protein n=1 Tax=Nostoc sp. 'Peltigera membranacea cyanobiont' N6 TaxID=1261031 RepID=UPI000CF30F1A|nr:hypothetical protein [Nostoc sp. 'Peltigera membranacea cyanobiont' N6]
MENIIETLDTEETQETSVYKQIKINQICCMAISGLSQTQIAKETGLSRETIRLIQKDESYQRTLQLASSKVFDTVIARLSLASSKAAQFLIDVLDDPESSDRIKLQAAKIILDLSAQAKNAQLEARLEALEAALSQDNTYA